jgi:hypothetical protein
MTTEWPIREEHCNGRGTVGLDRSVGTAVHVHF